MKNNTPDNYLKEQIERFADDVLEAKMKNSMEEIIEDKGMDEITEDLCRDCFRPMRKEKDDQDFVWICDNCGITESV